MAEKKQASEKSSAAKATLRSSIKQYIQQQIADGVYRPGDRIVETQLAKQLNVSQSPVREAMLELSVSGLLEVRPYSGTYVQSLSVQDIGDIFDTRAFIESHAAERAAHCITDEQLQALEDILNEMDAVPDENPHIISELDTEFHRLLVEATNSPALKRIWTSLRLAEWTYLSVTSTQRSSRVIVNQHRQIFHYLSKHDASAASASMLLHIKSFGEDLKKHLSRELPAKEAEE